MTCVRKTIQIGRNIAVRTILENAIDRMSMVMDELELWCITELAPEVRDSFPPNPSQRISVGLGILTRNTRTTLFPDHLKISFDGITTVKLPYDAIYCVVTSAILAGDLNWAVDSGVAYVNLVDGIHGLQKWS